jgi:hypothetical protein
MAPKPSHQTTDVAKSSLRSNALETAVAPGLGPNDYAQEKVVGVKQESVSQDSVKNGDAQADRALVDRCLAGEVAAWEILYRQCHEPLLAAISSLLRADCRDSNLMDEIAARVWYSLVKNDGELLDRFDPVWNMRLSGFLRGLARLEVLQYFRAEKRRRMREASVGRKQRDDSLFTDCQVNAMLSEFASTLTPKEQYFLDEYILSSSQDLESLSLTDHTIWQRRHRIRAKLLEFVRGEDFKE